MKCFSLELRQKDPITREIRLVTYAFLLKDGNLERLSGKLREFQEVDIIDFDREIGAIVGITYNDLIHGEAHIKVEDIELPVHARAVKVLEVERGSSGEKTRYFAVIEATGDGEQVIYSSHRALKLFNELNVLSKYLGISEKVLRAFLEQV